jgi:phosphoribosylglycinamide formyltransferase-1
MTGLGVLVSGSGTNLQAILDAAARGELGAEVRLVLSNVPGVKALERAEKAGVPTRVLPHQGYPSREAYDAELVATLRQAGVELVALAGFMRLVTPRFLDAFPGRVLNIHPSLLPAFPGLHAQRQALEHGAKVTGCTVHFVDTGLDSGPIVMQAAVPVLDGDDEGMLAARVLAEEHRLYPAAIRAVAEGRVSVDGRRTRIRP